MRHVPIVAVLFALAAAVPVLAHHSFAAEFDNKQPIQVKGVVTKIDWMNPHTWVYVDVKDEAGMLQKWQFETGAPNELVRRGWKMNDLKVGDQVSIDGFRAKKLISNTGVYTGNARSITLPGGLKVFAGSANQVDPQ
jgi:Family of unknown function (DUF6152)